MADNTNNQNNAVDNINDTLTGFGAKVQKNQKVIFIIAGIFAVIVLGVIVYLFAFRAPRQQAANEAVAEADLEMLSGNDSAAIATYKKVADEFGHEAGKRAALNAAVGLYEQGNYEEALKYAKDFSSQDKVMQAGAYSLQGDCYVNLKNYPEAIDFYKKAIDESDKNPAYTPFFMLKLARVYRETKDFKDEAAIYAEIQKDYPKYAADNGIDIEKYLERANSSTAEK